MCIIKVHKSKICLMMTSQNTDWFFLPSSDWWLHIFRLPLNGLCSAVPPCILVCVCILINCLYFCLYAIIKMHLKKYAFIWNSQYLWHFQILLCHKMFCNIISNSLFHLCWNCLPSRARCSLLWHGVRWIFLGGIMITDRDRIIFHIDTIFDPSAHQAL